MCFGFCRECSPAANTLPTRLRPPIRQAQQAVPSTEYRIKRYSRLAAIRSPPFTQSNWTYTIDSVLQKKLPLHRYYRANGPGRNGVDVRWRSVPCCSETASAVTSHKDAPGHATASQPLFIVECQLIKLALKALKMLRSKVEVHLCYHARVPFSRFCARHLSRVKHVRSHSILKML